MSQNFVHLRVRSEYSLSDSIVRLKDLTSQVASDSMPSVALTDFNNLFGLVKFYKLARSSGLKPIMGADVLVKYSHSKKPTNMTLLIKNEIGYRNLTKLISDAYLSKHTNAVPVIDFSWLKTLNTGLIALSGGREGEIGRLLSVNKDEEAREILKINQDLFDDRFYLEIQRTGRTGEESFIQKALNLSGKFDCPLVATNDVRFISQKEFEAHEARVCIHDSRLLNDPRRERQYSEEQYLRSASEMIDLFKDIPEAIDNTLEIAKRCNLQISLGDNYLPDYPIPDGLSADDFLTKQAIKGLEQKYHALNSMNIKHHHLNKDTVLTYKDRLNYELKVVIKMGFSGYFLIVMDFIAWAKQNKIPVGPGRGSGAGSLIAYVLEITDLDPIEHDLLFERFMNPERVSMPDFDIDFCMEGRDKVIDYVADRYGRDAVSQIVTFGTLSAKAVVRDIARVLGKPYALGDKLSKLIPFEIGITLESARSKEKELDTFINNDDDASEIWDLATQLEGITRNCGRHAGGVVISPSKITDFTPIYCDETGSSAMTQFDKNDVEDVGLVKFDFLGLRTLTIIDWTLDLINRDKDSQSKYLKLTDINLDDRETFEFMQSGNTTAVFQLESRGMRELIKKLGPDRFDDIIALVALFRPGPLQSGMVDDFISRKKGQSSISYPHPKYQHDCLKPFLSPTYDVILYKEQVMQIAQEMGGYTLGGADILRRAMGKKNVKEMAEQRQVFVEGAVQKGFDEDLASNIFDLMEKFAGYGFNKSHSAAYALLAYQTAWLKAHYPSEFMAATMSSDMDKTDKIVPYIEDCKNLGINVRPPSINSGEYKFSVAKDGSIIYGLGAIKGLGEGVVDLIVTARKKGGAFYDIYQFCSRVDLNKLSRRSIEALIKAGAFDEIGPSESLDYCRSWLTVALDDASKLADQVSKNEESGIDDLFGTSISETSKEIEHKMPQQIVVQSTKERLDQEKKILGLYLTGHPLDQYKSEIDCLNLCRLSDIKSKSGSIRCIGLITSIRVIKNKKGKNFAAVTLDDKHGRVEFTLWAETYDKYREYLYDDALIYATGEVVQDKFSGGNKIVVDRIQSFYELRKDKLQKIELVIYSGNDSWVESLRDRVSNFKDGTTAIQIKYHNGSSSVSLEPDKAWRVDPRDELIDGLMSDFGASNISFEFS